MTITELVEPEALALQTNPSSSIIYRPARPSDGASMALCATTAWQVSPFSDVIWPHRDKYPRDFIEAFSRKYRLSLSEPHKIGFIAVDTANNNKVVGLGLFSREGTDAGRQSLVRRQKGIWQMVVYWYYSLLDRLSKWRWPNRHVDRDAMELLMQEDEKHQKRWEDMYPNRWHCRSFAVHPGYQRKGIGSGIMRVVMETARRERVPIALEASQNGELLYQRLEFRLVESFKDALSESMGPGGGLMVYEPDTMDPEYLKR